MSKLILVAVFVAALIGWHFYDKSNAVDAAYEHGVSVARIENQQLQIKDLTKVIESTQALVNQAEAISQQLELAINARESADQKTTQEMYRALSRTASDRANCKFTDDVMQQLAAARDRANRAAASGIGYPVSTGTRTD